MSGEGGLIALDAKTGKVLRTINVGKGSSASPMTYMVGGKQYILIAASGGAYSGEYLAFKLPDSESE
jgi:glucose dehydrogenase